jgi:hypothetical protein
MTLRQGQQIEQKLPSIPAGHLGQLKALAQGLADFH